MNQIIKPRRVAQMIGINYETVLKYIAEWPWLAVRIDKRYWVPEGLIPPAQWDLDQDPRYRRTRNHTISGPGVEVQWLRWRRRFKCSGCNLGGMKINKVTDTPTGLWYDMGLTCGQIYQPVIPPSSLLERYEESMIDPAETDIVARVRGLG